MYTRLTGISAETVAGAPVFPELWAKIAPVMDSGILVAHNASFDMGVLRKCLCDYGIYWKSQVRGLCTVLMGRRLRPGISHRLNDLCEYYGLCQVFFANSFSTRQPAVTRPAYETVHLFPVSDQVIHVHIAFFSPGGTRYMAQPGTDQHQGAVSIRKRANGPCPSLNLPIYPL